MSGTTAEVAALLACMGAGVLSLVFARSAAHKVAEFSFFSATLGEYRLLPALFIGPVAIALTIAEIAAIGLLLFPNTRTAGAGIAMSLLSLYAVAMAVNLHRGRYRIDCGCGGPGQMISWALVVRNLILAGAASLVVLNTGALDSIPAGTPVVFGGVLLCGLLLGICDQIIGNRSHARAI
jgi:hypothetical protein